MKFFIKYAKLSGIFLAAILFFSFIFGLLNLIGLSYKVTSILNVLVMVILFLVFGFIEGINATKKGFLAGLKIDLIFLLIIALVNLILFRTPFTLSRMVYYLILLFTSIFGAMIGINRKKKE